ncbi:efflux RND transporter periplasmic adaptor subunit, partial [Chitinimonas koreensis]|uniref:efflux RND transporter periplasmic adaptor subunit n=1 Tax=Chitinimonas koreensis TaxID=356302 RepID=UPI0012FCCC0D
MMKKWMLEGGIAIGMAISWGTNALAATVPAAPKAVAAAATPAGAGFDCLIEPAQMVELSSPVTGLLERVTVRRGDKVARGQLLAALESTAEQASAELARYKSEQVGPSRLAEAKIEFSGRKFNRRRDMAADKLLSAQDRDDAEAEYKQAQAELQVARENREAARLEYRQQSGLLNLRSIRSPFDGVVVDQLAYPGEVVEPGAGKRAILKLAQLDPLRIRVILPMSAFGKPAVGMAASVVPELQGRGSYAAKVRMVDRIIDAASGTFVVFLDMPNPRLDIPS